jgi:hypothetical protein
MVAAVAENGIPGRLNRMSYNYLDALPDVPRAHRPPLDRHKYELHIPSRQAKQSFRPLAYTTFSRSIP